MVSEHRRGIIYILVILYNRCVPYQIRQHDGTIFKCLKKGFLIKSILSEMLLQMELNYCFIISYDINWETIIKMQRFHCFWKLLSYSYLNDIDSCISTFGKHWTIPSSWEAVAFKEHDHVSNVWTIEKWSLWNNQGP